jgi:hypothetical protein
MLALRMPYKSEMSSSELSGIRCAELDRWYPGKNGRGELGMSIAGTLAVDRACAVSSVGASEGEAGSTADR